MMQMLLGGKRQDITAIVHNTGEGGGEGSYDAAAGTCSITFANTGTFTGSKVTAGGTTPYSWLTSGLAASAEILVHQVSGSPVGGISLDTWLNLGTSRAVNLTWPGGLSSSSAVVEVSIRDATSLSVKVSSAPISMNTHP